MFVLTRSISVGFGGTFANCLLTRFSPVQRRAKAHCHMHEEVFKCNVRNLIASMLLTDKFRQPTVYISEVFMRGSLLIVIFLLLSCGKKESKEKTDPNTSVSDSGDTLTSVGPQGPGL